MASAQRHDIYKILKAKTSKINSSTSHSPVLGRFGADAVAPVSSADSILKQVMLTFFPHPEHPEVRRQIGVSQSDDRDF
jgi:hypothetical protein